MLNLPERKTSPTMTTRSSMNTSIENAFHCGTNWADIMDDVAPLKSPQEFIASGSRILPRGVPLRSSLQDEEDKDNPWITIDRHAARRNTTQTTRGKSQRGGQRGRDNNHQRGEGRGRGRGRDNNQRGGRDNNNHQRGGKDNDLTGRFITSKLLLDPPPGKSDQHNNNSRSIPIPEGRPILQAQETPMAVPKNNNNAWDKPLTINTTQVVQEDMWMTTRFAPLTLTSSSSSSGFNEKFQGKYVCPRTEGGDLTHPCESGFVLPQHMAVALEGGGKGGGAYVPPLRSSGITSSAGAPVPVPPFPRLCFHGRNCKFRETCFKAHEIDELLPHPCYKSVNCQRRQTTCPYIHPDTEGIPEYVQRLTVPRPKSERYVEKNDSYGGGGGGGY